jgi:hypothetical protein
MRYRIMMFVLVLIATVAARPVAQRPRPGVRREAVVVENPAGFAEIVTGVRSISVAPKKSYHMSVVFEGRRELLADLRCLRRIVVFDRNLDPNCTDEKCWKEVVQVNSRYGPKQAVSMSSASGEIIVVAWHVEASLSRAGKATAGDLSRGTASAPDAKNDEVRLLFESPYGRQHIVIR